MAGGRPTKYDPKFCKIAEKMCDLGATENDVAEALDVNIATITRWKHKHPEFCASLKVGKETADDRVEQSLYKKAVGYEVDSVKIFQFQGQEVIVPYTERIHPDTTAAIFWLKNRRPAQYRANPEGETGTIINNIMPVPVADSIEDWEKTAKNNQDSLLDRK